MLVTSWHDYPAALLGRTERSLLAWFEQEARIGETWLDIGSHYGYTTLALSQLVGNTGRVFAFEPLTRTAGHLDETRALNRLGQLTVIPSGLGDPESMTLIHLPTMRGMADRSLTLASSNQGAAASEGVESILVSRFDWLWPRICGTRPEIHGIKIDVQGMELDVVRGMQATLRTRRPKLVVEVHHGVDLNALDRLLREAGYDVPGAALESKNLAGNDQSYHYRSTCPIDV